MKSQLKYVELARKLVEENDNQKLLGKEYDMNDQYKLKIYNQGVDGWYFDIVSKDNNKLFTREVLKDSIVYTTACLSKLENLFRLLYGYVLA